MKTTILTVLMVSAFAAPAEGQWRNTSNTDEMTGGTSHYALSAWVSPTKRMGFPYSDVEASIAFGCQPGSEWIYFVTTEAPNLTGTETRDGYDRVKTRVRWDHLVESTTFRQEWGSASLHFDNTDDAINRVMIAGTVLVELAWYGESDVYFRVNLNGSTAAIRQARSSCGIATPSPSETATVEVPSLPAGTRYVGTIPTKAYYKVEDTCWASRVSAGNRRFFRTLEGAKSAGFKRRAYC